MQPDVFITYAKRTPIGAFNGTLKKLTAVDLAIHALQDYGRDTLPNSTQSTSQGAKLHAPELLLFGNVLSAGLGQSSHKQILNGLSSSIWKNTINAFTIQDVCGSSIRAAILAFKLLKSSIYSTIAVCGSESMSNAGFIVPRRLAFGNSSLLDHLYHDGLLDAKYHKSMGELAENIARKYNFTREKQDAFAIDSLTKAQNAVSNNYFASEILPISKNLPLSVYKDELPMNLQVEKIPRLKPAFNGTITAASASGLADGAAALVLSNNAEAPKNSTSAQPIGRIVAVDEWGTDNEDFAIAPCTSIKNVLQTANWHKDEVDCYEINEAFAVTTMSAIEKLQLDANKVNVHGGACAIGHPLGATGARIITTLMHALALRKQRKGIASLCVGGGYGLSMAIELVD